MRMKTKYILQITISQISSSLAYSRISLWQSFPSLVCVLIAQLYPSLWDSMYCSLLGSSVHGIFQARILEWVAISLLRGSSWPRDWTRVSCFAGRFFTIWATREALMKSVPLTIVPLSSTISFYRSIQMCSYFPHFRPSIITFWSNILQNIVCTSNLESFPFLCCPFHVGFCLHYSL